MIEFIPFKFPEISNVKCVFTTRLGGVSEGSFAQANLSFEVGDSPRDVEKNRRQLFEILDIRKTAELRQVHKATLIEIKDGYRGPVVGDAMITREKKLGLLIKVADCQPILITHKSGKYIGAFHVGWRANRGNFIKLWIEKFCFIYKIRPQEIMAVRGPSLGPSHSEFINFFKEWPLEFVPYLNMKNMTVDLWTLTRDQLTSAGILEKNIFSIDLCTYDLNEQFFSYRREKNCGRQGAIIWKVN